MKILNWEELSEAKQKELLVRPAISAEILITKTVTEIINTVKKDGDAALIKYSKKFDNAELKTLAISKDQINSAKSRLGGEIIDAIEDGYKNIFKFHKAQEQTPIIVETTKGVRCEMHTQAIESVGLYIPGGTAPLPSTVLMLGVPAQIANCSKVVLCSPPPICDEILFAASLCNISEIYSIGGAQAIAALAYGTKSVKSVDKIFGPGNAFVTSAKQIVSNDLKGAAIDMPAGPSEVLVIADKFSDPAFIAADLLSQAEHGEDSQSILVTDSKKIAQQTEFELKKQLALLSRKAIAEKALAKSLIITCENLDLACDISNEYAPEHLIIQTKSPRALLTKIKNAGSVFLGAWTPESVGDYASGTNHVLPTYGYTKTYSSLGLADFLKRYTVQEVSKKGLKNIAQTVTTLAQVEGLTAHKRAVTIRVEKLETEGETL